jgi:adenylosuccinate lyase
MFGTSAMRYVFSYNRCFAAWLETEVVLAKVQAMRGLITKTAATSNIRLTEMCVYASVRI